jgi:hypothetical protein
MRRAAGWCVRLDAGVDPATGRRRQISCQGFRTKREVVDVLNDLLSELPTAPVAVAADGQTVGVYLEDWRDRVGHEVRVSTVGAYRNVVARLMAGLGEGPTSCPPCNTTEPVLDAVADAPPPAFSGGGQREAMHNEMAALLVRDAADLGGSSIGVVDGVSKPKRAAADPKDYRRAMKMRAEFAARRTVLV